MESKQDGDAAGKPARSRVRLWIMVLLLLALLPFGVANLWAAGRLLRAKYAASQIEGLGGTVIFFPEPGRAAGTFASRWLLVGDNSTLVHMTGPKIGDADLRCLDGFSNIYILCLDDTSITDAGLASIASRKEIQFLSLKNTAITDAGLKELKQLSTLRHLDLSGTKVTDAGVAQLTGLSVLVESSLARTAVTDAAAPQLEKIPLLETIDLDGTAVSQSEQKRLKKLCGARIDDSTEDI